jgi:hypothetical protein
MDPHAGSRRNGKTKPLYQDLSVNFSAFLDQLTQQSIQEPLMKYQAVAG